ncbi:MAG: hypothetical protein HY513_04050 [Candidatus Aenigmarchaeota archaeon]|nr:hypothetical protein [Candidatus Aenigmarchaeota archaeon]
MDYLEDDVIMVSALVGAFPIPVAYEFILERFVEYATTSPNMAERFSDAIIGAYKAGSIVLTDIGCASLEPPTDIAVDFRIAEIVTRELERYPVAEGWIK